MPTPKLTRSIDGKMRMTIKIEHRLTPVQFVEHIAAHIHSSSEVKPPRSRTVCDGIVRRNLSQLGDEQILDYTDDTYFTALEIVRKAFPEFGLQSDDNAEKEAEEYRKNYAKVVA